MHLKNDKKCTIHSDLGEYMHFLETLGVYINELALMLKFTYIKKTYSKMIWRT